MKYVTNIMYGVFLLVLTLGIGVLFAPSLPYVGHVEVKIVKSGSMEPSINTGGIVMLREVAEYKVGDVVTFTSRTADIPTTHRIIGEEMVNGARMLITKGDANEERDADLVPVENVLGRVVFDIPYVGFLLDFARQPLGFGLLIGIPAFLIILDEIEKIWREVGRSRGAKGGVVQASSSRHPVRTPEPLVITPYVPRRVRMMDIRPRVGTAGAKVVTPTSGASLYPRTRFDMRVASIFLIVALGLGLVSSKVGGTVSFARDDEGTVLNTLSTISVGFTLAPSQVDFVFGDRTVVPGGEHTLDTEVTLEGGSVPLIYNVRTEVANGTEAVCDAVVGESGDLPISGGVSALSLLGVTITGSWNLTLDLADGPYLGGDTCTLRMVYEAWDASLPEPMSYLDTEEVLIVFTTPLDQIPEVPGFAPLMLTSDVVVEETGGGGGGGSTEEPLPVADETPAEPTEPVTLEESVEEEGVVPTEEGTQEEVPPAVEEEIPAKPAEEEPAPEPEPELIPEPEPEPESAPDA